MHFLLLASIFFAWLSLVIIALKQEFFETRVSNEVNAFFFFYATAIGFVGQRVEASYLFFVSVAIVFSIVLFALGAWGGGDAKLFIVLTAFYGLVKGTDVMAVAWIFLLAALFLAIELFFLDRRILFKALPRVVVFCTSGKASVLKNNGVLESKKAFAPALCFAAGVLTWLV